MAYWKIALGVIVIVGLAAAAFFFFVSPPRQLDLIDGMMGSEGDSARVAEGVRFGDQPRQQLDVWAPANAQGKKLPVLIFYYGGSWRWGSRSHYGFVGRAFAARGYVVVIPDYRLVPQVHFPTFLEDSAAATAWAQANAARLGGDPRQIYLIGHSAGAYNAAMIALDARYLRAAGGDPANISGVIGLAGPYDFLPFDPGAAQNAFGQAPEPAQTQPINFVRADAPPMLLLHGAEDKVVRIRNSTSLGEKLNAIGAKADVKIYSGADHPDLVLALSKPLRKRAPVLADINAFIAAQTPPRP